jgi:Domain of unknown function (DUF5658)
MIRFAPPTRAVALFASLAVSVPAAAQDHATQLPAAAITISAVQLHTASELTAAKLATTPRPNSLVPLYLSFAALQALDVHSTLGALNRGGVEANPLMQSVTGNPASLVAIKAAGTAGVLYTSERLWKKNPAAAIVFMVGANSAMAWVVQNNYRAAR